MSHSKLEQIARLREILKKWRRLALYKAHSFSDGNARPGTESIHPRRSISLPVASRAAGDGSSRGPGRVPAGHLAVYVGEERARFVIKTWYLSHPLFRALLKKTEEEIGFHQEGALALPCKVAFFEQLLRIIHSCKAAHHHHMPLPIGADDGQYEHLLQQLLEFSDLPACSALCAASRPLCSRSQPFCSSFNGSAAQAVVA